MTSIKIHTIQCGTITVNPSIIYPTKSTSPLARLGFLNYKCKRRTFPVMSFLIEHPNGLILVDTGWHKQVRSNEMKELGMQRLIHRAHQEPGQSIDEQLQQKGILPQDIDYVLLTHLHSDHVSGARQLKGAKYFLTSREERLESNKRIIRYIQALWEDVDLTCFEFESTGIGPIGMSYDLFGDGSIELIHAPGHSAGLFMVKITNKDGAFILLTSDAALVNSSWQQIKVPTHVFNHDELQKSLRWINKMSKSKQCKHILTSHDLSLKEGIIHL